MEHKQWVGKNKHPTQLMHFTPSNKRRKQIIIQLKCVKSLSCVFQESTSDATHHKGIHSERERERVSATLPNAFAFDELVHGHIQRGKMHNYNFIFFY